MPDRIADALLEVASSQRDLRNGLGDFTREVHAIDRRRRWARIGLAVAIAILLVAGIFNFITLQTVRCALTPHCSIYERNQKNSANVVGQLVVEGDCRARRAAAGLAAPPDPKRRCIEQTPMAVYPGGPEGP